MGDIKRWKQLQKRDIVDVIAPASSYYSNEIIEKVKLYISNLGLIPRISDNIYVSSEQLIANGYDPYCANTDELRLADLINAINSNSKAIWVIRGGYGSMRLIENLKNLPVPENSKLFIGFSDITALHLFIQKAWLWPTIHGKVLSQVINSNNKLSHNLIENVLFNSDDLIYSNFAAFNDHAKIDQTIVAPITGGNLCLVETSICTSWEIDTKGKIVFLEEVDERGYRVDRSLEHLIQAGIFENAKAVILGDFIPGYEKDGKNLIDYALHRFSQKLDIPVIKTSDFGHNDLNYPLPFGTKCNLLLADEIQLICPTGVE